MFASAERNLVFAINDFDETLPGPWEWDMKRLAASAVVAGRFLGADKTACEEAARTVVASYREHMREYAADGSHLDVWYSIIDEEGVLAALSPDAREGAERIMAKARRRNHLQVSTRWRSVDDRHHIVEADLSSSRDAHGRGPSRSREGLVDDPAMIYFDSLPEERQVLFARYRVVDVARKVVGVAASARAAGCLLLRGNDDDDPLFLQIEGSAAFGPGALLEGAASECEGRRVVVGQRLIQGAPDIFLGWGNQSTARISTCASCAT